MNTTSNLGTRLLGQSHRKSLFALATLTLLVSCIQGPWDYYPKKPKSKFQGVTVTAYAIAERPLENICFERLLELAEENTEAFAFYDSADIKITGSFKGVIQTLTLAAIVDTPNCFKGDSNALIEKGKSYDLVARLQWDSAGIRVTSVLTATAQVPTDFKISRTASAPSLAFQGFTPATLSLIFLDNLPPALSDFINQKYDSLTLLKNDSVARNRYFISKRDSISTILVSLQKTEYQEGATLVYLTNDFNTLSHYFTPEKRSPDVHSVLITHEFDPDSSRPETVFDSPIGLEPDSTDYYFPGNHRRLLIYPDAKSKGGWNLLDSLGVVNVFFHTGRNRMYFYGMEKAYYAYISTVTPVDGGGGGDSDPRIVSKFNVLGGQGIFAGGIPDTFDLYIKTDPLTLKYSLPQVRGLACRKNGWLSSEDCRDYYRTWCSDSIRNWGSAECRVDVIRASLEADLALSTAESAAQMAAATELKSRTSTQFDSASQFPLAVSRGTTQFCIEQNFPEKGGVCSENRTSCLESTGVNPCKQSLWDFCKDNLWRPIDALGRPTQCGAALASYCNDKPRLSETLCKRADAWCALPANAGSVLCK